MPFRLTVIASLLLAAGSPASAQEAPPPPPSSAAAPDDAAIAAAARTFREQVEAMNGEVRAAVEAAGANRRRAASRVEDILTRYTPGFEAFAGQLEAHFDARAAAATTDEARAAIRETAAASLARVRGLPDHVRAGLAQQAQTRGRPEQPRNTQPSTGY